MHWVLRIREWADSQMTPRLLIGKTKTDLVGGVQNEYEMPVEHATERTNSWFYKQIPKFNKEIWVRIKSCFINIL